MPIYEYVCSDCGNQFEELVAADSEGTITCPKCGSGETQRVLSAVFSRSGGLPMADSGGGCGPGGGGFS